MATSERMGDGGNADSGKDGGPAINLTERQLEVLRDLERIRDKPSLNSRALVGKRWDGSEWPEEVRGYWAAPMDFGGGDGSHHSTTARRLAELGLVDRYKDGRVNNFKSRSKGSCGYRINAAGIAYIAMLAARSQP